MNKESRTIVAKSSNADLSVIATFNRVCRTGWMVLDRFKFVIHSKCSACSLISLTENTSGYLITNGKIRLLVSVN